MSYSQRAAIYEVEYTESRDVTFVLSLLGDGISRVIEVPCGAGRLSRHLAPRVAELHLVDLESDMVTRATGAARGAAPDCSVHGHVQDMRLLDLNQTADLAILPREALQLVPPEDGCRVLAAVARHIRLGGRIVVDLARFAHHGGVRDPDYFRPGHPDGVVTPDWSRALPDGGRLHRSSMQCDEGNSLLFYLKYRLETETTQEWSSQMRIYRYDSDFLTATVQPGLRVEHVFGGYDRSPLLFESRRMIAIYQKTSDMY
ncbi:MAG: class I SAM-dependent methyltransferase [Paracoccaceae bacterium]|nr:class I SAM-dependent methyltransferase [Paracoccaceae bacterium]